MTPEGEVKDDVKRILKSRGIWFFMPVPWGRVGIPDFCCVVKGQAVFIETKAGKNKPTPMQKLTMSQIREAGGIAVVVNEKNLVDLDALLESLE